MTKVESLWSRCAGASLHAARSARSEAKSCLFARARSSVWAGTRAGAAGPPAEGVRRLAVGGLARSAEVQRGRSRLVQPVLLPRARGAIASAWSSLLRYCVTRRSPSEGSARFSSVTCRAAQIAARSAAAREGAAASSPDPAVPHLPPRPRPHSAPPHRAGALAARPVRPPAWGTRRSGAVRHVPPPRRQVTLGDLLAGWRTYNASVTRAGPTKSWTGCGARTPRHGGNTCPSCARSTPARPATGSSGCVRLA